jgi:hypothetical protein
MLCRFAANRQPTRTFSWTAAPLAATIHRALSIFTDVHICLQSNIAIQEIEKGLFLGLVVVEKAQARI